MRKKRERWSLKIYGDNLADKIITHVAYIIQHGENILVWNDVLYEFFFVGWGSSASPSFSLVIPLTIIMTTNLNKQLTLEWLLSCWWCMSACALIEIYIILPIRPDLSVLYFKNVVYKNVSFKKELGKERNNLPILLAWSAAILTFCQKVRFLTFCTVFI